MDPDDLQLNIGIRNFAPSGSEGELRTIAFGPMGPITLLVTAEPNEETGQFDIEITLSNATEHENIHETLGEFIQILQVVHDNSQREIDAAVDAASTPTTDDKE